MQKKQKRIVIFSVILFVLVVAAVVIVQYVPISKILQVSGSKEPAFVNRQYTRPEVPNTLYCDFEVDPNSGNTGKLYKGIAHSGQYSTKTFGKNSFSFAVERKAGDIGIENLGAVAMSAWVYVFPGKDDPSGSLVFTASNDKINVAWKGVPVGGSDVPRGKWFKVSGMFDISDVKFRPEYNLVFYFWNTSSADILVDDLYISFGGPKPRRGDSTLTDLTHGIPFSPRFNSPPYPFHLFEKEETGNGTSSFLVKNDKIKEGDISPYDRIFSGHFVSGNSGTEELLVIGRDGNAGLYSFCREKKSFRKILPVIPSDLQPFFRSGDILTGSFTSPGILQLLLSGPGGLLLGEFEKVKDRCSGDAVKTVFKPLLKIPSDPFQTGKGQLIAADLDGNRITEILSVAENGSWKVFRFENPKGSPALLASGDSDPLKQWNRQKNPCRITAGRFLRNRQQDLLLSVSGGKSKPGPAWTLLRYDPASRTFIPCYGEKQNFLGKTIGPDTLKPGDEFLTGNFDRSGTATVFRYNRDWRYDLKEIRFGDTTFQVVANMDFSGYESDFNPKYYEVLRLVPAMLVTPGLTSLLVIGKNCKSRDPGSHECDEFIDLPDLPGTVQVCTFRNTEK
jgi:hypothetical protein